MVTVVDYVLSRYTSWLVFAGALFFFVWITAPGMTFVNTDADGSIYLAAAKYLIPSHPTGAPVFNLFNHVLLKAFPVGSEAWRLSLGSGIAAAITALLLFKNTRSIVAPLVFMGSGVVASQVSIIETYAVSTLFMVAMYHWRHSPKIVAILAVFGLGIHHLVALTFIPILMWHIAHRRDFDIRWYALVPLTALWYIYLPLAYYEGSFWISANNIAGYRQYFSGNSGLILGLALMPPDDLFIRIVDIVPILLGGFVAATAAIVLRMRNDLLTWLFILPILHYALGLPHVTYIYTIPAFAFGGIMAAQWLREHHINYSYAIGGVAALMVLVNWFAYDIGDELDGGQTAEVFYAALADIPADSVIWTYSRGWELTTAILYNFDNGTHIKELFNRNEEITIEDVKARLEDAANRDTLFHSVLDNPRTYASHLEPVEPEAIWPDVVKEFYGAKQPPADELDYWRVPSNLGSGGLDAGPASLRVDNGSVGVDTLATANH